MLPSSDLCQTVRLNLATIVYLDMSGDIGVSGLVDTGTMRQVYQVTSTWVLLQLYVVSTL